MKFPTGGSKACLPCTARLTLVVLAIAAALAVPSARIAAEDNKQVVHLYFADAAKPFLIDEQRVMVHPGTPTLFGRQIVTELINGPAAGGKLATIPRETRLRAFFLLDDGTAVVDFSSPLRDNHPGGCRREQLTLFSVVNSLVLNEPAIDRVQILIAGTEHETLTGHVPIDFPLTADMLLTR